MVEEATLRRCAISAMRTVWICFCGIFSISSTWPTQSVQGVSCCATICTKRLRNLLVPCRAVRARSLGCRLRRAGPIGRNRNRLTQIMVSCQKSKKNCRSRRLSRGSQHIMCFPSSVLIPMKSSRHLSYRRLGEGSDLHRTTLWSALVAQRIRDSTLLYGPGVFRRSASSADFRHSGMRFPGHLFVNQRLVKFMEGKRGKVYSCRFSTQALYMECGRKSFHPGDYTINPLDVLDCILMHKGGSHDHRYLDGLMHEADQGGSGADGLTTGTRFWHG